MSNETLLEELFASQDANDLSPNYSNDSNMDDAEAYEEYGEDRGHAGAPSFQTLTVPTKSRVAKTLLHLRGQVNARFPNRKKASDGTYGDKAHCPNEDGTGKSDHCPNIVNGEYRVVTALDITHDPDNDCDCNKITEGIRESKDKRVKYVIWNKRIFSDKNQGENNAWEWRAYTGTNPHTKHLHLSVQSDAGLYDDEEDWIIDLVVPA